MRSHPFQSAFAPVERYICLSCRFKNARRLALAQRRHSHTDNPKRKDEQVHYPGRRREDTLVSQPSLHDKVRGLLSSNGAKKSREPTTKGEGSTESERLKQEHNVRASNSDIPKQTLHVPVAVDRKLRRRDYEVRRRKTASRRARRRLSHQICQKIPSLDAKAKDISLEDLTKGARVPGQGLQTLTALLRANAASAAGSSNPQGMVKASPATVSTLEKALLKVGTRLNNEKRQQLEEDPTGKESEREAKKTPERTTKKASTKATRKAEKATAKRLKASLKDLEKERRASLSKDLTAKVNKIRTRLQEGQRRDQEMKRVAGSSEKKAAKTVTIGVKPRKVVTKDIAPTVSAPRTAGVRKDAPSNIQTTRASELRITPVNVEQPPVPSLAYGLERVLFNPGVYQLQDPRSRVYNFDPYLQKIMPIADFDFNALKEYITSSKDKSLQQIAKQHGKRYVGSTSSMTGTLAHFHFLISQWRSVDISMLSKSFPDNSILSFTELQRTPAAIFLKWKDGSYAIDADKQFDSSNVLSMLGKSMEKLLTLKTEDFERYRKSSSGAVSEEESSSPESYHYSTFGDFLMRSQLDAHDPRLPGTGMFDLKTRAVVSIRMDVANYEHGTGYEIKNRHGEWESYEREYYDMIRAAFLKYSMQVRMGRMDGIFVAFHNVERIFGFQYISLPEMDSTIHGQWDTTIGDQEFTLSLDLLNKILDKATKKFPKTSIRLHFETRDAATPFMYIFAEPVTEEQVAEIQNANQAKAKEFERNVLGRGLDQDSGPQWADIQAEVEKAMDKDELALDETQGSRQNRQEMHDPDLSGDSQLGANALIDDGEEDSGVATAEGEDDDGTYEEAEDDEGQDEEEGEPEEEEEDNDNENEQDEDEDEGVGEEVGEADEGAEECGSGEDIDEQRHEPSTLNYEGAAMAEEGNVVEVENDGVNQLFSKATPPSDSAGNTEDMSKPSDREDSTISSAPLTTSAPDDPNSAQYRSEDPPEFATEADRSFLDVLSANSTHTDSDSPADDILAMTLTLRNRVNGQYVLRPTDMTAKDKWEIEYSLVEVPLQARARALYQACQLRRQKKLADEVAPEGQEEVISGYVRRLREMSAKGKIWRAERDETDRESGEPVKVLGKQPGDDKGLTS